MKVLPLLFTFFLFFQPAAAQVNPDSLAGEYHLQGVMETATALLLKPDSTFEIFFSYGAVDRQGSGKWSFRDGKVTLNSRPWPLADFKLVTSKDSPDPSTTVRIVGVNPQLMPHFEVLVKADKDEKYGKMDQEGIFQIPEVKADSINLFFNLVPERFSSFPVKAGDNYFEFNIEPWIAEIFAENVTLKPDGRNLRGEHPLLKSNALEYVRMK